MKIIDNQTNKVYSSYKELIDAYPELNLIPQEIANAFRRSNGLIRGHSFTRVEGKETYNRNRTIICLDTGETYNSASELARALGVADGVVCNYFKRGGRSLLGRTYVRL